MTSARYDVVLEIGASFRRSIHFVVAENGLPWPLTDASEIRAGGKISPHDEEYQWYASTDPASPVQAVAKGTVEIKSENAILVNIPPSETEKMLAHSGWWNLEIEFNDGTVVRALSGRYEATHEIIK